MLDIRTGPGHSGRLCWVVAVVVAELVMSVRAAVIRTREVTVKPGGFPVKRTFRLKLKLLVKLKIIHTFASTLLNSKTDLHWINII